MKISPDTQTNDRFRLPIHLTLALMLLTATSPAFAQMDIEALVITSGPAYDNGVFTDYFLDPELDGTGIAAVRLFRQNGAFVDLVEDPPGTWACDEVIPNSPCENFPTLSGLRALGELTFAITGALGETDTIVIPFADWDPGAVQPAGIPTIFSPTNGEVDVSLTPTFTWDSAPGWVDLILAEVQVTANGDVVVEELLAETENFWQPSGRLPPGISQEFRLSFFDVIFIDDPRTSAQSDAYLFTSGYEAFNFVTFRTVVPVPGLGIAGGVVLTGLLVASSRSALRRRRQGSVEA